VSGKDYCYVPPSGELVLKGDEWHTDDFPLAACEGDCDSDTDCQGDLICHQRGASERVPGCTGTGYSGKDYCHQPVALQFTGEHGTHGECEGDCDDDWDCDVSYASGNLPLLCRQNSYPKCLATTSHVAE
jgi:hypothetical protein